MLCHSPCTLLQTATVLRRNVEGPVLQCSTCQSALHAILAVAEEILRLGTAASRSCVTFVRRQWGRGLFGVTVLTGRCARLAAHAL